MGCTTTTLKFSVVIMNILCAIFSVLMISASAYGLANFPPSVQAPCAIGIVLGSLLLLTTLPGCFGPIRESVQSIWTYSACIFLLMIAQIIVNIFFAMDFQNLAAETIGNAWQLELTNNGTMAVYEVKYFCCGKGGPDDYISSGLTIPLSCYKHLNSTTQADLYTVGCIARLEEAFEESGRIEVISDWTLVGFEGVTAILAAILGINLKNIQRRQRFFH